MIPPWERIAKLEANQENQMNLLNEIKDILNKNSDVLNWHIFQESKDKEELKIELKEHIDRLSEKFVSKEDYDKDKKETIKLIRESHIITRDKNERWYQKPFTREFWERWTGFLIIGSIVLMSWNAMWDWAKLVWGIFHK